ncbi:ubiquinone/menaquinone biosynthesis methyltransferase [Myxococcota bacterium]|nr:ubiquinone/menaquinone biosynthesis methyltransferase [Myxococcota bacterium]MCZ7617730.1 ubiquinone/menaquinone biosynthesis methyltransferase [Myxococcota bacterium]
MTATTQRAASTLPVGAAKRAAVQAMFDRIAPRYDVLNRLLTGGLDQRWRRIALDAIAVGPGDAVLDLACGTGNLAEQAIARGADALGIDFARGMLRGAQRRRVSARFAQADAAALPLPDSSIDAVVCGFALRNFTALPPVFAELARVLTPGGRIALLDVDRPPSRLVAAGHSLYFDRVVPRIGGWLSDRSAYAYLPRSTSYLPAEPALLAMLRDAGFRDVHKRRFLLGAAQLLTARRAGTVR